MTSAANTMWEFLQPFRAPISSGSVMNIKYILAAASILLVSGQAVAANYKLSFVASGFTPVSAPANPVTGSITFSAASLGSPITGISALDLTIVDHKYSVSEVGYLNNYVGLFEVVGGTIGGVETAVSGTNDFVLDIQGTTASYTDVYLGYSTIVDQTTTWATTNVIVDISAVPEPSTYILMLGGAGLFCVRKRFGQVLSRKC
jgi:hypothetical protein